MTLQCCLCSYQNICNQRDPEKSTYGLALACNSKFENKIASSYKLPQYLNLKAKVSIIYLYHKSCILNHIEIFKIKLVITNEIAIDRLTCYTTYKHIYPGQAFIQQNANIKIKNQQRKQPLATHI